MKRIIFCAVLLCVAVVTARSQPFEGKIVYQNTYKIPEGGNPALELMTSMMGDRMEYFIKGGSYKSVMNGTYVQYQVYAKSENRIYQKIAPVDTLYWMDASADTDQVMEVSVVKDKEEILGLKCNVIVLKLKNGSIHSYYFNSKYPVDANSYKNHKMGNWAIFTETAKALPLKTIIETPQFTLISVATEVKAEKLKDSDFAIPDLPKKKSPF